MNFAVYSIVTTNSNSPSLIIGSERNGPSKCFGIKGISTNSAYVIRLLSNKYYLSQISYTIGTGGSTTFSSISYDMNGKIVSAITISKAVFK